MKVVMGLGNPGLKYDATRHNVGWWLVDRLAFDWDFPSFTREGEALVTEGVVGEVRVRLMKPLTYMNRSGASLGPLAMIPDFDFGHDFLVAVDDASLDVGRVRFRPSGSPGGHNGLKSLSKVLAGNEFPRVRIGVGQRPTESDLAEWVLSEMPADDEQVVVDLLPEIREGIEVWLEEGVEAAMNRYNR